ncbi:putative E3 ubiquitin-protein ligase [Blastocladiella emersonii ATCC 22665]|nr:putative E3 ubiquitin-protein ligase [Blastocladiella emersonii ATCC 22665]
MDNVVSSLSNFFFRRASSTAPPPSSSSTNGGSSPDLASLAGGTAPPPTSSNSSRRANSVRTRRAGSAPTAHPLHYHPPPDAPGVPIPSAASASSSGSSRSAGQQQRHHTYTPASSAPGSSHTHHHTQYAHRDSPEHMVNVYQPHLYQPQSPTAAASAASRHHQQQYHYPRDEMTKGNCRCCRSELSYPVSIMSFRCSICDYVNDLGAPLPPSGPIVDPLSLSSLKELLTRTAPHAVPVVAADGDPASSAPVVVVKDAEALASIYAAPLTRDAPPGSPEALKDAARNQVLAYTPSSAHNLEVAMRLRAVFSQWPVLNASFANPGPPPRRGPNLNLPALREAWRLIAEQPHSLHITILNAMLVVLMRVGRPITDAGEIQAFLIMLECPFLARTQRNPNEEQLRLAVLSRLLGHISALPNQLHYHLVEWSLAWPAQLLGEKVDLINQFLTHRLMICQPPPGERLGEEGRLLAQHYTGDWQIVASCRTMALLFSSNNKNTRIELSHFYNTMVDLRVHLLRDFDAWERRQVPFTFCQYPFTLSLAAKLILMEFEAKRAMFHRFREAVAAQGVAESAAVAAGNVGPPGGGAASPVTAPASTSSGGGVAAASIAATQQQQLPYLPLKIRRASLVEDSLAQLADPSLDLKKRVRVSFVGEEGIDAGGLTKEWLLLLVKELFDPKYGMWLTPANSAATDGGYWFNPGCGDLLEFFLTGVVLGLAVYHSTILDVPLAAPCFKKLLKHPVGLADLAELDAELARGLQQLLDYDQDDVEDVFCREFVGEYECYGETIRVPLVPNGASIPVTRANRKEYVAKLVEFKLTTSVARQYDSFASGFTRVLQGNALSLFRPEEIELLVRGSVDIDIAQIEITAEYEGWAESHRTVRDLWAVLAAFDPPMKRAFIKYLTGTDRVPSTGVTVKVTCLADTDSDRLPIAHTCFNQLGLYAYATRDKLRDKLVTAVLESEGFGIK